jgi:predicted nucleic acid-binding protein
MPVVDASVMFELLAVGEHKDVVKARLLEEERALWAPELLDAEIGHALRRAVRQKAIDADQAAQALWELGELPVHRVSHELLVHYAWAVRDSVSFYDGLYVALAAMLEEPLLTLDARLGRAKVEAEIDVLAQA